MKIYQVVISFLDPAMGTISVEASSEEEAVNIVKSKLEGEVQNLRIEEVKLIVNDPNYAPGDFSPERTVN